ncbi:MAG TPA: hypothetical protein VKE94_17635, partial [Gemmataceae bacterium]|nr:hypothetical protein [Gemmataceae bacterium]
GDVEALAGQLTHVLSDVTLRRRLGAAGPAFVEERFGLETMIDRTLAVYEHALGRRSQPLAA